MFNLNSSPPCLVPSMRHLKDGIKSSFNSPLVNLAPELMTSILAHLEDDTGTCSLLSCSLTNKCFTFPSRRVLVRTVALDAPTGEDLHKRHVAFRHFLMTANGSSLARPIRFLSLRFGKGVSWAEQQDSLQLHRLHQLGPIPPSLSFLLPRVSQLLLLVSSCQATVKSSRQNLKDLDSADGKACAAGCKKHHLVKLKPGSGHSIISSRPSGGSRYLRNSYFRIQAR